MVEQRGAPVLHLLVAFARALRRAGLVVPVDAVVQYVRAIDGVGIERRDPAYWGGRTVQVEAFALGTRLTRLTRQLSSRDADSALTQATAQVLDWSGGTRLGEGIGAFNTRFGMPGMARGAIMVILSDGWDRGDPVRLATEMARLRRAAHQVIWVNPLKASVGYEPLARGMVAALPHIDQFVEGHSAASFDALIELIAR